MEGLRLYPPVPMTFRKAAKSDYIDGIWVPKGTLFYMPVSEMHHWIEVFNITTSNQDSCYQHI